MSFVYAGLPEMVGGWSTFALAWLGIFAFLGTLLGLAQSRRDARRARTLDYLRRFSGEDFAPLNTQVLTFLATADPGAFAPGATLAKLTQPAAASPADVAAAFESLELVTQARVKLVLNFYEEMSCSYREDLLDEALGVEMLVPTIAYGWKAAEPFIKFERERAKTTQPHDVADELMKEWEALHRESGYGLPEGPKPPKPPSLIESLDGTAVRLVCAVGLALVIAGLMAIGVAAAR